MDAALHPQPRALSQLLVPFTCRNPLASQLSGLFLVTESHLQLFIQHPLAISYLLHISGQHHRPKQLFTQKGQNVTSCLQLSSVPKPTQKKWPRRSGFSLVNAQLQANATAGTKALYSFVQNSGLGMTQSLQKAGELQPSFGRISSTYEDTVIFKSVSYNSDFSLFGRNAFPKLASRHLEMLRAISCCCL